MAVVAALALVIVAVILTALELSSVRRSLLCWAVLSLSIATLVLALWGK